MNNSNSHCLERQLVRATPFILITLIALCGVPMIASAAYRQCVAQLDNPQLISANCSVWANPRVCTYKRWSSSNETYNSIPGPQYCISTTNDRSRCEPEPSVPCWSQTASVECIASTCPSEVWVNWPTTWQSDTVTRASGTRCE